MMIGAISTNSSALRLSERHGAVLFMSTLIAPLD